MRALPIFFCLGLAGGMAAALPAAAQDFTTAAEVRPILEVTKPAWIAVREYDGKDLVYFTQVLSWRCGVAEIHYGLNGAAPETLLAMEPCHDGEAQPNALKMESGSEIYLTLPLQSVQSVKVVLTLDDGSSMEGDYARAAVLMP